MEKTQLPPLPEHDSIVHIYPWDLERMASNETTATAFSVAVGCPDGESVPLYTAEQMQEYALAALAAAAPDAEIARKAERYEKIRLFSPRMYAEVCRKNIAGHVPFDQIIDAIDPDLLNFYEVLGVSLPGE